MRPLRLFFLATSLGITLLAPAHADEPSVTVGDQGGLAQDAIVCGEWQDAKMLEALILSESSHAKELALDFVLSSKTSCGILDKRSAAGFQNCSVVGKREFWVRAKCEMPRGKRLTVWTQKWDFEPGYVVLDSPDDL